MFALFPWFPVFSVKLSDEQRISKFNNLNIFSYFTVYRLLPDIHSYSSKLYRREGVYNLPPPPPDLMLIHILLISREEQILVQWRKL